jgi:hypothetical protein
MEWVSDGSFNIHVEITGRAVLKKRAEYTFWQNANMVHSKLHISTFCKVLICRGNIRTVLNCVPPMLIMFEGRKLIQET